MQTSNLRRSTTRVLLNRLLTLLIFLTSLTASVVAPFPPCSPLFFVNKFIEANNWSSDMNPFYPVRPCPYRDPRRAPPNLRFALANHPADNLYHVATETKWFFWKGIPRALRMLFGREQFLWDPRILNEGHSRHHTRFERQRHFGRRTRKKKSYY